MQIFPHSRFQALSYRAKRKPQLIAALVPRIHLYIHGPEMKEFLENLDDLNPIVFHYSKGIAWVSIVGIEKKVQVNLPSRPCVERRNQPNYDASMASDDARKNLLESKHRRITLMIIYQTR
jgi:hypothetical protein